MPLLFRWRHKNRAEKFLANTDRGLDSSTLSRDVIDLAHMIEAWSQADAAAGIMIARGAYGSDVDRKLALVTQKLRDDKRYRSQCIDGLMIANPKVLMVGLERLARADWPSDARGENAGSGVAVKGADRKKPLRHLALYNRNDCAAASSDVIRQQ